jgi:O-antigen/teichoic acid export membrane protein
MMVQMGESLRQGQFGRLLAIWHDTTRKLALLFFPLVACLIVNGYAFITFLYTTAYTASVPIFMLWSLTILFPVFQADGVLRVFAQNRWLMLTNGLRLVLVVSLMGWFLSSFNIIGPVFVTLAGAVFAKTMMLAKVKRLLRATTGNLFPWKDLGSIGLAAVLATIPPAILNAELNVPVLVLLPLSGMAYMITYGLLVLVLGLLNEAEKTALKRSLYVWNRGSRESRTEAGL